MLITKTLQRCLHTASANYVRRKANPGVGIQTQVFKREGVLEPQESIDNYDDMESDFMEVHKTHKQYEQEMHEYREKMRHWIVKNKYFKQKLPNFLTYAEKEQIKILHTRDPEEWSVEKLAESFPANQEVIHKIIQSKWIPKSTKRVKKHNATAMENWEKLQKGEFPELSSSFRQHLMKFASRKQEDSENLSATWKPRPELPRPTKTEFLSIITSCRPYADKEPTQKMLMDNQGEANNKLAPVTPSEEDTYLSDKIKDKRNMRLQELKTLKLMGATETPAAVPDNPSGTGIVPTTIPFKYISDEIVVSAEDVKKFEMTKVKDRIYIPQKLRKKGATYKVDDCFYDDDGEFLYRVPGMTGRKTA